MLSAQRIASDRSPCYFSRSSPTDPDKLNSGRISPPFSGSNREFYSFAIILRRCLSSTLRSAPLPTGKDPDSRLRMLHAVILRLLIGTHKIMKIYTNKRYKISVAKSGFYRVSAENYFVSTSSFVRVPYRALLPWGQVYNTYSKQFRRTNTI